MSQDQYFFNLDNPDIGIARERVPGINTRIFAGDQAMLSFVSFKPHSEGSSHSHAEEQWGVVLEGSGTRIQNGESFAVKAGDFWVTPGGVEHSFIAGPDGAKLIDIFAPPREAYRTSGAGYS